MIILVSSQTKTFESNIKVDEKRFWWNVLR